MSDAECGITSIHRSFYSLCVEKHVVGELKNHAVDSFVIASAERLLDTLCVFVRPDPETHARSAAAVAAARSAWTAAKDVDAEDAAHFT